jgi:hypothetical protein
MALGQVDESSTSKIPSTISSSWQKDKQTLTVLTRFG